MFQAQTGGSLPDCSDEDMWAKPAVWALKKTGGVRAKSLHYSEDAANKALEDAGKGYEIEFRPGERTRCENYCNVRDFCSQWAAFNKGE